MLVKQQGSLIVIQPKKNRKPLKRPEKATTWQSYTPSH